MKLNLICSDIDGTLLNKDRQLSELTISEIKRIQPHIPLILISSRMPKAMRHLQTTLSIEETPMIAYNGGLIIDGREIIQSTEIHWDILTSIVNESQSSKVHLSIYRNDEWYVPELDYWAKREQNNTQVMPEVQPLTNTLAVFKQNEVGAHKVMAMGAEAEIDKLSASLVLKHRDELHLYRSKKTYLEIANKTISKETALQHLLKVKYPDVGMSEVIAFGDNYNDIDMLKAVGLGVAVANAKPEVLSVADEVTMSNVDNGVGESIRKYFRHK